MNIVTKQPTLCSKREMDDFIAMARSGGEVDEATLPARARAAACLVFLREGEYLRGIAALKNPHPSYRNGVSRKTGIALEPAAFPFELGYVFVLPSAQGRHLSRTVATAALAPAGENGVWATSRTGNVAMHRTLSHCGFLSTGRIYSSGRGKHQIQLFTRSATQQHVPLGRA